MTKKTFDKKDIEDNKGVAAISYLFLLCLVPLFLKKDSPYAQAHAKQGLSMCILWLLGVFFFWIPLFGWLLWLVMFFTAIMSALKAWNGEYWEIPIIKEITKALNL